MRPLFVALIMAFGALQPAVAATRSWIATTVDGAAFVAQDGKWTRLQQGAPVTDGQALRTTFSGHVVLTRNGETIEVMANSLINVRSDARFTTVSQTMGTVSIEDTETPSPHLAVATPYMVAVVKGTVFTVTTSHLRSSVEVASGRVEVSNGRSSEHLLVLPGQSASTTAAGELTKSTAATASSSTGTTVTVVTGSAAGLAKVTTADATDAAQEDGSSAHGNSANAPGHNKADDSAGDSHGNSANAGSDGNSSSKGNSEDSGGSDSHGNGNANGHSDGKGNNG